jgi:hypothetical protein
LKKLSPYRVVISRVINAPLSFVYSWWTDFREDDPKITGQERTISIFEHNGSRIIMSVSHQSDDKTVSAARIVSLMPPDAWHLDWIGDEFDETGDYKLTPISSGRTKLAAIFKVKPKTTNCPDKANLRKNINEVWVKYIEALESDASNRARRE